MRDAISILEKSISYSTGNELSLKTVYDSNSDIDYDSLFSLLDKGILEGNEQIVITTLEDWYLKGIDFNLLVNRFLDFCFDISKYIISNNIQVTKIPSDFLSSLDRVSKFENSITYFNYYIDELIKQRIELMLRNNPNRINFYEEYQEIIKAYNSEQDRATIEKTFMALIDLSNTLDKEEKRFVREGFADDEQLTIFDLLFKKDLSKSDIAKLKKVSIELLDKVKSRIKELHNWTEKPNTQADIQNLVKDTLWINLPDSYSDTSILDYSKKLYEYIFERYPIVAA